MQGLDVWLIGRFDSTCAAIIHVGSAFQQLPFPFRHLIWMDFVLLGDFRQRLILNEQQSRTPKRRLAKLSSQKAIRPSPSYYGKVNCHNSAGEGHCERKVIYEVIGQQKAPDRMDWGLSIITSLTMTYFHTGCSTIIGAKSFHGPVRDGKGWYQLAIVIRHNL